MTTIYSNGPELNSKILAGVSKVAEAVASTMGPHGKSVILCIKDNKPILTKDGFTVASFMRLDDPIEDIALQILREATTRTNKECGDGTSTTTVLANAILVASNKFILAGVRQAEIIAGLNAAAKLLIKAVEENARPVQSLKDLECVASISANDPKLGAMIAEAVDLIGKNGSLTIETSNNQTDVSVSYIDGFKFNCGYLSGHFTTDKKRAVVEYNKPLILVTDAKLTTIQEMLPVLQQAANEKRPLIIVADSIEGQALSGLIVNMERGSMAVAAVAAPHYGQERLDFLQDLAIATGATFISKIWLEAEKKKLADVVLEDLGLCQRIEITRNSTLVVGGAGKQIAIQERVEMLQNLIQSASLAEAEVFQERLTRLVSSVAIIKIGGYTESEVTEKRYRVEDALEAVRSAREDGVTIGGGCALLKASKALDNLPPEYAWGSKVLQEAIKQPITAIISNSGRNISTEVIQKVLTSENEIGYDAVTETYTDLMALGIIDPVKVIRNAILNGISAASSLLNATYCCVRD